MPPKKNKKPSRNGYWEFVLETRGKQSQKNMSKSELESYCATKWSNMSKEQRAPYETRAKLARDEYRPAKYTTDGLEIEAVERQEKEAKMKEQEMKTEITRQLKAARFTQTLKDQVFLIGHINHLVFHPVTGRYFICEVAISAFSLKDGVKDVYHAIVHPGQLPLGYYGTALAHSKETHQLIELALDEPLQDNTGEVFHEMVEFMKKHLQGTPILFVAEQIFEMATVVIENFRYDFKYEPEIKVYNLQYLFYALRNAVAEQTVWPTETFSYNELEKDIYCYTPNISCEFHEMSDISLHCSKSIVTRSVYSICDHCCADLKIQLEPGFHVPQRSKVVAPSRGTSAAPSVCSNDEFRYSGARSVTGSVGSSTYEDNYPSLGSSTRRSAALSTGTPASVVSFTSMKSTKPGPSAMKTAARIEQSFKSLSMGEPQREIKNFKFPEQGYKRHQN